MLLYAIYTPDEITSWEQERVYAFASIERFVEGMRLVNEKEKRTGILRPVTWEEAKEASTFATLFIASGKSKGNDGPTVLISENGIRDNWDGKWREVTLAERIEEESIPGQAVYA